MRINTSFIKQMLAPEVRGEIYGLSLARAQLMDRRTDYLYGTCEDAEYALDNPEYKYVPSQTDLAKAEVLKEAESELFAEICETLAEKLPLSRARKLAVLRRYHDLEHQEWNAESWKRFVR